MVRQFTGKANPPKDSPAQTHERIVGGQLPYRQESLGSLRRALETPCCNGSNTHLGSNRGIRLFRFRQVLKGQIQGGVMFRDRLIRWRLLILFCFVSHAD